MKLTDVIRRPLVTEKTTLIRENNRTLVFDRWSQPHYGIHSVVDVRRKKLVMASAFLISSIWNSRHRRRAGRKSSSPYNNRCSQRS